MDFSIPVDHIINLKESVKRDRYLDLLRELKTMEHEGDGDTKCNWCTWNNIQRILKIDQNTENSPEYFKGLALTQLK